MPDADASCDQTVSPTNYRWWRMYVWGGVLVVLGIATIVVCANFGPLGGPGVKILSPIFIGLLFGSLLGQMSAATYWVASGPGKLLLRSSAAVVWLSITTVSFALALDPRAPLKALAFFGVPILAHLILSQPPMWAGMKALRLRLIHGDDADLAPPRSQFGIGQMLAVTTLIAVLLSVGRVLWNDDDFTSSIDEEVLIVVGVNFVMLICTLPVAVAALWRCNSLRNVVLVLALIPIITGGEYFSLNTLLRLGLLSFVDLLAINLFASAWVLAFAVVARRCGYRLVRMPARGASLPQPEAT